MIRLAQLSDIHLSTSRVEWRMEDWFNKRFSAWFNYRWLGRRHRFQFADEVLEVLMEELGERQVRHILFSGDATALGFDAEIRKAAEHLRVQTGGLPGLAIPGNHDYCTPAAAASGNFERHFGPWQDGQRIDGQTYPFAQRIGSAWFVGVNSATGNRLPWDAAGSVGPAQLERLRLLLAKLEAGPRILITHFPVALANGEPEHFYHGLRDLAEVVRVAAEGGVKLWLHGHRHQTYFLPKPSQAPFPVLCAGSATQTHLWSYLEHDLDDNWLNVTRRIYDEGAKKFREGETFQISLV